MYKIFNTTVVLFLFANLLNAQKTDAFQIAMYMEKWPEAVTIQEERCQTNPADGLNWLYMADAYNAANRPADAKTALENAASHLTQPAYQYMAEGRLALLDGQQKKAVTQFEKAAKAGKKDLVALRLIGEAWLYGSSRDLHQAEEALHQAQRRDNHDFQTHLDLGYCYKEMISGGEALIQYDQAQAIRPESPVPALLSALVYKSAKVETKQLEYLDKAIQLDPQFQEAWQQKGELLYYKRRDYQGAADAYAQLIKLNPQAPVNDKMLYANSLFLTKQYEPTIMWVEKIIGEDGSRNYLRRLSAYSYYEIGNFEKGKAIMDEYFARVDTAKIIAQDYEYYAKFLQKEDQDSLAAVYYEKAIGRDSSRWELYGDIGAIRYKTKDYLGAVAAYEHRLDSLIEHRTALDYYQIGIALYMLHDSADYVRAAEYFTQVCEIVPDKTIGWLMLSRTLSKLEPDLENYPERTSEFGMAKDAFSHYVEIAEIEPDKNQKDLIAAYEYLAYYYMIQKSPKEVQSYVGKLLILDPNNESAVNINGWLETASTDNGG